MKQEMPRQEAYGTFQGLKAQAQPFQPAILNPQNAEPTQVPLHGGVPNPTHPPPNFPMAPKQGPPNGQQAADPTRPQISPTFLESFLYSLSSAWTNGNWASYTFGALKGPDRDMLSQLPRCCQHFD